MKVPVNKWLLPVSWLYGAGVAVRNYLFDNQILLKTTFYDHPIICVGNLTVGGTGKTPHIEYLIRLLQENWHIAVLSRGYKRKTKGFELAASNTSVDLIGDEPYQMKHKFQDVTVAVCENRNVGISQLMEIDKPDVILLDDAYQHRYVKAGLSILLTDYHRLMCDDSLLPMGRLREPFKERHRAQIIIVTKCPKDMGPIHYRIVKNKLALSPFQHLFYTSLNYAPLVNIFDEQEPTLALDKLIGIPSILLLTGIANPTPIEDELKQRNENVTLLRFADHHNFTEKDIQQINQAFDNIRRPGSILVTTEKDAARLRFCHGLSSDIQKAAYALPIEIIFLQNKRERFNTIISNYVRTNQKYNRMDSKPTNK